MPKTELTCTKCTTKFEVEVWQIHMASPVKCPSCGECVDKCSAQKDQIDKRHVT